MGWSCSIVLRRGTPGKRKQQNDGIFKKINGFEFQIAAVRPNFIRSGNVRYHKTQFSSTPHMQRFAIQLTVRELFASK